MFVCESRKGKRTQNRTATQTARCSNIASFNVLVTSRRVDRDAVRVCGVVRATQRGCMLSCEYYTIHITHDVLYTHRHHTHVQAIKSDDNDRVHIAESTVPCTLGFYVSKNVYNIVFEYALCCII